MEQSATLRAMQWQGKPWQATVITVRNSQERHRQPMQNRSSTLRVDLESF